MPHYKNPLFLAVVNEAGQKMSTFYDVRQIDIVSEHGSTVQHVGVYNGDDPVPSAFPVTAENKRRLDAWNARNAEPKD